MPLLPILRTNPQQVVSLRLPQVVALCGQGILADNAECSRELRQYLMEIRTERLFDYIETCLHDPFEKSGFVLQDLVNELGRRLDYQVENGLYQGRSNAIGFDGIWTAPDGHNVVVEIKTTDTYRINLDTIVTYREELIEARRITRKSSILIIVGRQDTGDLEAQVRGSKHAWDVRLISVDALIKLVKLKEDTEEDTVARIHDLLIPLEYTRLDRIIDIAFTAAKDTGAVLEQQALADIVEEGVTAEPEREARKQERTPSAVLDEVRQQVIQAVSLREGAALIKRSAALYWSPDRTVRVACSISKRYDPGTYWYAYHPHWDRFLSEGSRGFFVLGCVGRNEAYALPFDWIHERLDHLYTTERDGGMYWHIYLEETPHGEMFFKVFKLGLRASLETYRLTLEPAPGQQRTRST